MGVESLCNAVAYAVKRDADNDSIKRAKITGTTVQVTGRSYSFTVAVDIPINNGDWVYVMLTNNRAVVIGR